MHKLLSQISCNFLSRWVLINTWKRCLFMWDYLSDSNWHVTTISLRYTVPKMLQNICTLHYLLPSIFLHENVRLVHADHELGWCIRQIFPPLFHWNIIDITTAREWTCYPFKIGVYCVYKHTLQSIIEQTIYLSKNWPGEINLSAKLSNNPGTKNARDM